ncbi:MAG: hypothetical protein OXU79_16950 [Gemmatimonadota bacterium]|nr:hypothetical protein [Gemmatimonadota bacterium]
MSNNDLTVLFDESGTPQIVGKYRNEWFLGCGVRYEQSAETEIFARCYEAVGLSKNRPMKNHRISIDRVIRIARILTDLPLSTNVSGIDTIDPEFRKIVKNYRRFVKNVRATHRPEVRDRAIGQIIHSQVLDHCLFHSVSGYFEAGGHDAHVSVFIDNWSVPNDDAGVYLEERAGSLDRSITSLCSKSHMGRTLSIGRIELLKDDTNRKRFVDVVASIFSRAFLRSDNPRYTREAMDILVESGKANFSDATGYSMGLMQMMMNGRSRDGKSTFR